MRWLGRLLGGDDAPDPGAEMQKAAEVDEVVAASHVAATRATRVIAAYRRLDESRRARDARAEARRDDR